MSLLEIGTSALLANQTGLKTVGHNIANANVEGYSRQQTLYSAQLPQRSSGGFVGSGVVTQEIRRVSDQFLTNQLRQDIEQFNKFDTYASYVGQLEALLADEQAGLSSSMQAFFASLQSASENPSSITVRQQVLGQASNLENRFNTIAGQINSQAIAINQQVTSSVDQINRLAANIADLNHKIAVSQGASGGAAPNDLLDKRDILLNDLSSIVSVQTTVQDGNQINVFIGKGQSLVVGAVATTLNTISSPSNPGEVEIAVGRAIVSDGIDGGALGSLLDIRSSVLTPALNQLGQLAIGLADSVNQQQALGIDLFDQLGSNLFADINNREARIARALPNNNNNPDGTGLISVTIDDVSRLTTDEYTLNFIGPSQTAFTLTRESDGEIVAAGDFQGSLPATVSTSDGFSVNLESGAFFAGDSVRIQPVANGARDFAVQLDRPEGLAFAQPVRTSTEVHNTGNGVISPAQMLATSSTDGNNILSSFATAGQLSPPLLVRFDSETSYSILDNSDPNQPTSLNPPMNNIPFVPGAKNELFTSDPIDSSFRGYQVEIGGSPKAGDEFKIEFNTGGVGDNRNVLAMVDLQSEPLLNQGVHSLNTAYSDLVRDVASQVGQARIDRDASESLMNQTQNARDSVSGVNLDEEAARLIQLEQAYNASSQVIQVARDLFNTLLNAVS